MAATDKKLHLKELELNALLEVTQAINANMPEEALYRIYHFTLITNLQIVRLALFVLDDEWNCKVNFGTKHSLKSHALPEEFLKHNTITHLTKNKPEGFEEFDTLVPVTHKEKLLAMVLLGGLKESADEHLDLSFVQTFTNVMIVAIENKKLARKELQQEALRKEMQIARDVQAMLFPRKLPNNDKLTVWASYYPHQTIGGDYYDLLKLDEERYMLCIGDVSGKGIPAALLMSNVQASLRTMVRQTADLEKIVRQLNDNILQNANGEKFITFFIALLDLRVRGMQYINAGHNPPALIRKDGSKLKWLENGCTILGVFERLPQVAVQTVEIPKGSVLFLYTDGVTDVTDAAGQEYGPEELEKYLLNQFGKGADGMHSGLHASLDQYRENTTFPDDITFMTVRFN